MASYREILSGRRRGLLAASARSLLACAEVVYGAGVWWRNRRYDGGGKHVHRVPVPVISVGNVTAGGTGKSPFIAWLAQFYKQRDVDVAIVSRGYGAKRGEKNDEALELEQRLPGVPHVQNPDRVVGACEAIRVSNCQLLLLDDAFQHRRLHRDLDIVLIDALEPFGYGHLLPRGLLREPLTGLQRADVIALSRADLVSAKRRAEIELKIRQYAPHATWIEVAHEPRACVSAHGTESAMDHLSGQRLAVFCGIGNPQGFRQTLEKLNVSIVDFCEFPDHHRYAPNDVKSLAERFDPLEIDLVLCTMKDWVKLRLEKLGRHPLHALRIDLAILAGRVELESHLGAVIARGVKEK